MIGVVGNENEVIDEGYCCNKDIGIRYEAAGLLKRCVYVGGLDNDVISYGKDDAGSAKPVKQPDLFIGLFCL